ncbi:MAG: carbohydrate ABC transporter permease [Eubacterium sp.]|nr:carbohydrate ABC transporter permease [Eubacterium sp.]
MEGEVKTSKVRTVIAYILLIFLSFLCLFFFYILIINSTRSHAQIMQGFSFVPGKAFWPNLKHVLQDANIPVMSGIRNSLIVSTCSALLATYFSALTAYGLYAYNFKFKKPAFIFIMLILVMPTQVSALGFYRLMDGWHLLNTLWPLFLPSIAAPAVFYFMYSYMQSSLPMELVEAARIDGCNEFRIFNRIVIPIMKPAMAVQAIFAFVTAWNNFFIPALIISDNSKKTLPILIAALRSADFLKFDLGKVYMLILIAIVPIIIVYIMLSRYIVAGVALGGVKE